MKKIRSLAKKIIPRFIWNRLGNLRRRLISRSDHRLSTQEVFSRIYEKGLWSVEGEEGGYSSGDGSRNSGVVTPYLTEITRWAREHDGQNLGAVDLGCGDFHIGRNLYAEFGRYTGVDIVRELIDLHRMEHTAPGLSFICANAITDPLPEGDVIFVRQVLQHLSNAQILGILPKLSKYRWAIVTEHLPSDGMLAEVNLDKSHGGGIRLARQSGVFLEEQPFCLACIEAETLLDVQAGSTPADGRIVTTCYRFR